MSFSCTYTLKIYFPLDSTPQGTIFFIYQESLLMDLKTNSALFFILFPEFSSILEKAKEKNNN